MRWEEQRKAMQQDAQTKAELARYQVCGEGKGWVGEGRARGGSLPRLAAHLVNRHTHQSPPLPLLRAQDELARRRAEGEHEKQRERNRELVLMQEEAARRSEEDKARVQAQASGVGVGGLRGWVGGWAGGWSGGRMGGRVCKRGVMGGEQAYLRAASPIHLTPPPSIPSLCLPPPPHSLARSQIEAERRATERYRAELEKGVQRERALAEAEGRADERRKNQAIYR